MALEKTAESLSEIERKALSALGKGEELSIKQLAEKAGINIDSARRATAWLEEKGLADVSVKTTALIGLSKEGKEAVEKGLPEKRFVDALKELGGKASFGEVRKKAGLTDKEFNVALGITRKSGLVSVIMEGKNRMLAGAFQTGFEKAIELAEFLEKISTEDINKQELDAKEKEQFKLQLKRGLVVSKETSERSIAINKNGLEALRLAGKTKGARAYDIKGSVPELFIGKRQPYVQFLSMIKRKLVQLGFTEMPERLVTQEFYNFDVLFQPQNHPARTWTDTYQLKKPKLGKLPAKKVVDSVKASHENGGRTGSRGWGYKWSEGIARQLMPNAHGTTADARKMVEGIKAPCKYFVVNRCYRPDVVDATHLSEFNQLDGFIVGEDMNFKHLLGILKQFALEFGKAEKVKFYPDYYPFTEPSVQLSAKHPELGWIELAGAGIFRPEIMKAVGVDEPAIAWGIGIDRLAMLALGVNDMRYLFSQNLKWLRQEKLLKR